jgi:hypothetical protein
MAFRLNWRATSTCWILFHANAPTKRNQQQPFLSGASRTKLLFREQSPLLALTGILMESIEPTGAVGNSVRVSYRCAVL